MNERTTWKFVVTQPNPYMDCWFSYDDDTYDAYIEDGIWVSDSAQGYSTTTKWDALRDLIDQLEELETIREE